MDAPVPRNVRLDEEVQILRKERDRVGQKAADAGAETVKWRFSYLELENKYEEERRKHVLVHLSNKDISFICSQNSQTTVRLDTTDTEVNVKKIDLDNDKSNLVKIKTSPSSKHKIKKLGSEDIKMIKKDVKSEGGWTLPFFSSLQIPQRHYTSLHQPNANSSRRVAKGTIQGIWTSRHGTHADLEEHAGHQDYSSAVVKRFAAMDHGRCSVKSREEKGEFVAQELSVKEAWGRKIAQYKKYPKYRDLRAPATLRLQLKCEPTTEQIAEEADLIKAKG
ncbi:hypothetical protein CVT25_004993 [Psilocybe cyanescens]|uniref:Uncharacterized protein n=1 Tax=Psilocybe cyanescens TaxID=93625 RepID=A0A409X277_PSICY|nr:hypothetical protein CVT25_004993 [Psilocybe cyanescens]